MTKCGGCDDSSTSPHLEDVICYGNDLDLQLRAIMVVTHCVHCVFYLLNESDFNKPDFYFLNSKTV